MNKILFSLFTAFAFVGFMGCSEDEDASVATEADLAGTWTLQSADFDFFVEGQSYKELLVESGMTEQEAEEQVEELQATLAESGEFAEGTIINFKSDKNFLVKSPDDNDFEEVGTWELSGDGKKITIGDNVDDMLIFDILSISSKNLSLNITMTDFDDMEDDESSELPFEIKVVLGLQK